MKKKILAIILTVAMAVSMVPAMSFAVNGESSADLCGDTNPTTVDVSDYFNEAGYSKIYDGTAHEAAKVTLNDVQGTNTYTWYVNNRNAGNTVPQIKNAGEYLIGYKISNDLYDEKSGSFTVTITPKPVEIEWDGPNYDGLTAFWYTYDGKEHCPTAAVKESDLCAGDSCDVTVEGAETESGWTFANAETLSYLMREDQDGYERYKARAVGLSNSNYVFKNMPDGEDTDRFHYFVIERQEVRITANPAEKNFGDEDPLFTGTVVGYLNDKDLLDANVQFCRTNPGANYPADYTDVISATYNYNNNYHVCYWEGGECKEGVKKASFSIKNSDDILVNIAPDYIKGKTLVLVFLNSDGIACQYDRGEEGIISMIELKNFGYRASNSKMYVHVFGLVVEGISDGGGAAAGVDAYKENVLYTLRDEYTPYVEYTNDVNGTGVLDVSDAAAVSGVYNNREALEDQGFGKYTILRANYVVTSGVDDTLKTNDNEINTTDINRVHTDVLADLAK